MAQATINKVGTPAGAVAHGSNGTGGMAFAQFLALVEATRRNGQAEQTIKLYRDWVQHTKDANKYLGLFNFGSLLQEQRLDDHALEAYEQCLALSPNFSRALVNMGLVLERLGRSEDAIQAWTRITSARFIKDIRSETEFVVTALNHIGRLQEQLKNYAPAEAALEESLRLDPDQPDVIQHWVHIRQKACKWPVNKPLAGISKNRVLMCTSPLAALAAYDDPVKQLLVANSFVKRHYPPAQEKLTSRRAYRHKRLRVGYVSGDLCVHAVGLLVCELFEGHDSQSFEIFAYDFSPEDGSNHRQRIKTTVEHWRDIRALSDRESAELVLADEIDVLIDLHGLSSGARPGIFNLRPAPLQGTYLGFIGTTSFTCFDFVVTDRFALTQKAAEYFSEEPLYVDGSFLPLSTCMGDSSTMLETDKRSALRGELGFNDEAFVMAAFGNVYKINQSLFEAWMQVLKDASTAVLWLLDDNPTTTSQLTKHANSFGIGPERLRFTPRVSPAQFRQNLKLADVFLDTYPYNCGSTSNDVIAAGIPLVTCSGETMVSRMGGSILTALGMDHLIASDLDEYQEIVIDLASGTRSASVSSVSKEKINEIRTRMVRSLERGLVERYEQLKEQQS